VDFKRFLTARHENEALADLFDSLCATCIFSSVTGYGLGNLVVPIFVESKFGWKQMNFKLFSAAKRFVF